MEKKYLERETPPVISKLVEIVNKAEEYLWRGMVNAYERKHPGEKLTYGGSGNDLDLSILQPGDIIIYGAYSRDFNPPDLVGLLGPVLELLLIYLLGGRCGHTAVYVGEGKLVEGLPITIRKVDYEIVHTAGSVEVYRVKTTEGIKGKAVKFCESKVGVSYGILHCLPLFYPIAKHVEGEQYYCSELAWAAYKSAGIDINAYPELHLSPPINGFALAPQNICDSDNVELIASAGKR